MSQGGFGLVLSYMAGTVKTAITDVVDAKFPKQTSVVVDATTHDSSDAYYEAVKSGKRRLEPFEVTVLWDPVGQASHAALLTAYEADTTSTYIIEDPDNNETISFSAFIESIERISEQDGMFQAVVTFHPSGKPTIS